MKSLTGETVPVLELDPRGCVADRLWSVRTRDGKIGSGKNTRRFAAVPRLLELRAQQLQGRVLIGFPSGHTCWIDDPEADRLLSEHCQQPLRFAPEERVSHFDDGPVSIVGTASVAALSSARGLPVHPDRFRANILVATEQPFVEDQWLGRHLRVGTATLEVRLPSTRCVMIDMKTADLPAQEGNLTGLGRLHQAQLGVIARVVHAGRIASADELRLIAAD